MKKWISLLTCTAFIFSSIRADDAPPAPNVPGLPSDSENFIPPREADTTPPTPDVPGLPSDPSSSGYAGTPELSDDPLNVQQDEGKKQVGQAANDGSKAAGNGAGKYVLAGCAIAIGIAALILVSKNHGHHKK